MVITLINVDEIWMGAVCELDGGTLLLPVMGGSAPAENRIDIIRPYALFAFLDYDKTTLTKPLNPARKEARIAAVGGGIANV